MEDIADDSGVDMNCTNAQDHVTAADHNNGTIKETICTKHHQCGHNATPKQMIITSAEQSMNQLNVFPAKHGMSESCSPETIVAGHAIDHNKHCTHKFGKCAQAHHEPKKKNSMKEQTIDTIYS